MIYRMMTLCAILVALAAPASAVGDDAPAWLQQVAAARTPVYKTDVPAVVLHRDAAVSVGMNGRLTTVETYAIRILTREGRHLATAAAFYDTDSGQVREMRAWLIRPDGSVKKYGKDQTVDAAASLDDVYNETRVKVIDGETDADVGAVFGYQTTTEEQAMFPHLVHSFQSRLPTLLSRLSLTVPSGWTASSVVFNSPKMDPVTSGTTYTWELRNLAPIDPEPASPTITNLAPRVAVSFGPASGAAPFKTFANWTDVSKWYSELSDPQAAPDDAIALKARELTAGAKTEFEKIQAIARFVQGLQYISIQIGVGRFRPHAASEVFAKRYGDCKDKANLMRAMLRAIKIESYPVLIFSGDRTYVREEWASPGQFNHCIIAIRVSDETKSPAIIQHASLGRLLIFDATDDATPVGDLPSHEQGSLALVAAGEAGALLRMPVLPADSNQLKCQTEVALMPDGTIKASVKERFEGQPAARVRRTFRDRSRADFTGIVERWITGNATGASVSKIEPADSNNEGRFALDVEFTAPNYARSMQQRLLVFKPAVVPRRELLNLSSAERKHPVVLESWAYTETVNFKLPEGFEVDELPDALKIEEPFGSYAATYEVKDNQLLFTRTFMQHAATVPAEKYNSLRTFYERIRATEQSPVVLARQR